MGFEKALDLLEEVHGPVVRGTYISGVVKRWQTDPHTRGGFPVYDVFQKDKFLDEFQESPHERVTYAGSFANKWFPGWVESALQSALVNVWLCWPRLITQQTLWDKYGMDPCSCRS